jgi:2-polyprenyl-6-methoxyphenol hydroxylase-like FAD-dependent oxidoreductase
MVCDVAIIGAGPSGSLLSLVLARSGLSVALLDQGEFPRRKVCGGCLNGRAMTALAACGLGDLLERLGARPVTQVQLCVGRQRAALPLPATRSVSRTALDAALIEEAQAAGVAFFSGTRASLGAVSGGYRRLEYGSRQEPTDAGRTLPLGAKIVVLAHGLKDGAIAKHSRLGAGTLLTQVPQQLSEDRLLMVIGRGGYVGGVRVEGGQYDLAAALDVAFLKAHGSLALAVSDLFQQGGFGVVPEMVAADWRGTPLLTRRRQAIAGQRWFAVGDAAGYVEPFTGEGMAWAMGGALALAPLVQSSVVAWDDGAVTAWSQLHRRVIVGRQWPCRILSQVLRSPLLSRGLIGGLHCFPSLAGPVMQAMNRPPTITERATA